MSHVMFALSIYEFQRIKLGFYSMKNVHTSYLHGPCMMYKAMKHYRVHTFDLASC